VRERWSPGDAVVLRQLWRGKVWSAFPVRIVADTDRLTALYMAPGTLRKKAVTPRGGRLRLPSEDFVLTGAVFRGGPALRLSTPGAGHSVTAFWDETSVLVGWYVDLCEPLRRSRFGFDYMDQLLDIVVSPDLSCWAMKDEDEFREARRRGIFSAEEASRVHAEARRVVELLEAGTPPFDRRWQDWVPDPSWSVPSLPRDWETP